MVEAGMEARRELMARKTASPRTVRETVYTYTVLFEPAAEGGYTVTVPMLPGAITEGDTLGEARERAQEVIRGYLKLLRKRKEPIPVEGRHQPKRPIVEKVAVSV